MASGYNYGKKNYIFKAISIVYLKSRFHNESSTFWSTDWEGSVRRPRITASKYVLSLKSIAALLWHKNSSAMCHFPPKVYIEYVNYFFLKKGFKLFYWTDPWTREWPIRKAAVADKFVTDGAGRHSAGVGIRKKTGCHAVEQVGARLYLVRVPDLKVDIDHKPHNEFPWLQT